MQGAVRDGVREAFGQEPGYPGTMSTEAEAAGLIVAETLIMDRAVLKSKFKKPGQK